MFIALCLQCFLKLDILEFCFLSAQVLFFGSPVETLGATILSVLSLYPGKTINLKCPEVFSCDNVFFILRMKLIPTLYNTEVTLCCRNFRMILWLKQCIVLGSVFDPATDS